MSVFGFRLYFVRDDDVVIAAWCLSRARCMHVASNSGNPEPSPVTAIAACSAAGVLLIGNLHGVVEVLALECGAPESERQVSDCP